MDTYSKPPEIGAELVREWRERMFSRFQGRIISAASAQAEVLRVEEECRTVVKTLHGLYGTPHLGNRRNPTDEFIYIILSRKTPEKAYQKAFLNLKQFGSWEAIADLTESEIVSLIYGSGLEAFKAVAIKTGLLTIRIRFGRADLSLASPLNENELFNFLADLPGVGPKSARCIMLYAFGCPTFPVDTHVGRVLCRLGMFESLGVSLEEMDHKRRQAILSDLVPPDQRYSLRVNLIAHGRAVCFARRPQCERCPLVSHCLTGSDLLYGHFSD